MLKERKPVIIKMSLGTISSVHKIPNRLLDEQKFDYLLISGRHIHLSSWPLENNNGKIMQVSNANGILGIKTLECKRGQADPMRENDIKSSTSLFTYKVAWNKDAHSGEIWKQIK